MQAVHRVSVAVLTRRCGVVSRWSGELEPEGDSHSPVWWESGERAVGTAVHRGRGSRVDIALIRDISVSATKTNAKLTCSVAFRMVPPAALPDSMAGGSAREDNCRGKGSRLATRAL